MGSDLREDPFDAHSGMTYPMPAPADQSLALLLEKD